MKAGRLTAKAKNVTAKAKFSLLAILAMHKSILFCTFADKSNKRSQ
jgi:hypothetical protein